MNYIIFDIAVALLLLLALWRGYRRGFILTLCGFLAIFVALIGASIISNALAEPVAHAIRPVVERGIHQSLEEAIRHNEYISSTGGVATLPEELPLAGVLDALQDSTLYRSLADTFRSAVDQGLVQVTSNAALALADYIAVQLARVVLFLIAFVAVLIAWFFLSHALDLVAKLPVINGLNRWSGAVLGLFKGGLLLFIACWLFKDSFLPPDAVQNTYLLRFFCTTSPLSLLSWL